MKVIIWGENPKAEELYKQVQIVLEELGLSDFVEHELSQDISLAEELSIKEHFALIIEEESIGFKDMIFEEIIPENEELKSMFYSIIGGGESGGGSCSSGGCSSGSCGSGCSC